RLTVRPPDLYDVVWNLETDLESKTAYKANSREYAWWMMLPHGSFQELINFNRQTIVLLHTHWIALAQIMAFITEREYDLREKKPIKQDNDMDPGFVRWLKYLNA